MKDFVAYNSLNFLSKKARNVFRTYLFTYIQHMKAVETILSEKIEVDERWVLSDEWLSSDQWLQPHFLSSTIIPRPLRPQGGLTGQIFVVGNPCCALICQKKKRSLFLYYYIARSLRFETSTVHFHANGSDTDISVSTKIKHTQIIEWCLQC